MTLWSMYLISPLDAEKYKQKTDWTGLSTDWSATKTTMLDKQNSKRCKSTNDVVWISDHCLLDLPPNCKGMLTNDVTRNLSEPLFCPSWILWWVDHHRNNWNCEGGGRGGGSGGEVGTITSPKKLLLKFFWERLFIWKLVHVSKRSYYAITVTMCFWFIHQQLVDYQREVDIGKFTLFRTR